jgi:hypothetical protein
MGPEAVFVVAVTGLARPVEIGSKLLIFHLGLVVEELDEVSHGNDPDHVAAREDRELPDLMPAHLTHHLMHLVVRAAGDGIPRHDLVDRLAEKTASVLVKSAKQVTLREDPDQSTDGVEYRQRADILTDESRQGFIDGILRRNRHDLAILGSKHVAYKHCDLLERGIMPTVDEALGVTKPRPNLVTSAMLRFDAS